MDITWQNLSAPTRPRFAGRHGDIRAWVGRRATFIWGAGIEITRHAARQRIEVLCREAFNADAYGWDAALVRAAELAAKYS